jgi:lipoprotein-anchoring transpeptidase ErfK/SrfK
VHLSRRPVLLLAALLLGAAPGAERAPGVTPALLLQIQLDRAGFSPGVLDGRQGENTREALRWFQRVHDLPATGRLDAATRRELASSAGEAPLLTTYRVRAEDLAGPFIEIPASPYAKEELDCLCYESAAEALAERFHTTVARLAALNPGASPRSLEAGDALVVPAVGGGPERSGKIERIEISLREGNLRGLGPRGELLFYAPVTVGSRYKPSPHETLRVKGIAEDPRYYFKPEIFGEIPDYKPNAVLPPGPNSPVGTIWIDLSKEGYGIHGTDAPETIGYASSHGCIRLTNWDAEELAERLAPGIEVAFTDARRP